MVDVPPSAGEDESACRGVFSEFMTKVALFEQQVETGTRLLTRFQKELEYFRRPPIPKDSGVMSKILKTNCTSRMKSYMEAGCSLQCQNISNINQLHLCEEGLKNHINKVKTLLQELECLVEDIHAITLTASVSALEVSESSSTDNEQNNELCFVEEKTVGALSLKTPSSELEGYCLMWDLRPYIDDNVMHLAWKMCP